MTIDPELEVWREQWRGEDIVPDGLRRKVERQTRMIRIALALDVLVTILMGGWTTTWAMTSRLASVAVLAVATWIFIAVAWIFVIANLRGAWAPHELSVAEFTRLSISRCRARLRATLFAGALAIVEIVFCLWWLASNYGAQDPATLAVVGVGTAVLIGVCAWYYRRQRRELSILSAAERAEHS
jgi:hypothetical protein